MVDISDAYRTAGCKWYLQSTAARLKDGDIYEQTRNVCLMFVLVLRGSILTLLNHLSVHCLFSFVAPVCLLSIVFRYHGWSGFGHRIDAYMEHSVMLTYAPYRHAYE